MKDAHEVSTAPLVAVGLFGGFLTARESGIRPLGVAVVAAAGRYADRSWYAKEGWPGAAGLSLTYHGGFGASHPLAKKIGAWPADLAVSAVSAAASYAVSDSADTK